MHREISRGLSIRVNNQWNRGQEQQIANIPESYRQTNLQVGEKNGEDGQQLCPRSKTLFRLGGEISAARSLLWRPMRRGERVLIFALSLSSNAKWIPHMHPLLEADAYCYSTFREAFLPLRSRMRPLLEIA